MAEFSVNVEEVSDNCTNQADRINCLIKEVIILFEVYIFSYIIPS